MTLPVEQMSGTVRALNRSTSKPTPPARRLYGLTDQLQGQLRVLEVGLGPVHVRLMQLENADIEALAFVVLMQAAKSAQEDLEAIMESVKAINGGHAEDAQVVREVALAER
jgi:hypothetical protein